MPALPIGDCSAEKSLALLHTMSKNFAVAQKHQSSSHDPVVASLDNTPSNLCLAAEYIGAFVTLPSSIVVHLAELHSSAPVGDCSAGKTLAIFDRGSS